MSKKRLEVLAELSKLDQELGRYDEYLEGAEKSDSGFELEESEQDIALSKQRGKSPEIKINVDDL